MSRKRDSAVSRAEQRLRSVINTPGILDRVYADRERVRWAQLCSGMDVIGDSDLAIQSYLASPPIEDKGALYILAYGLLQVLFVQQDALAHVTEAVGLPYTLPQDLTEIRNLRNDAIGHPTKRGKSSPLSYGVVRVSLRHDRFDLYCFNLDKREPTRTVQLKELIARQQPYVVSGLEAVTRHVETTYG